VWVLAGLLGLVRTVQTSFDAECSEDVGPSATVRFQHGLLKKTESQRRLIEKGAVEMMWQTIWKTLMTKLGSFNLASAEVSMVLLKEILENNLVDSKLVHDSQSSLWKLSLFNEPAKCGVPSIEFLISLVRRHDIKDDWNSSEMTSGIASQPFNDSDLKQSTRRGKLIEWLLLSLSGDIANTRLAKHIPRSISPNLIVSAVIALLRPGSLPHKDFNDQRECGLYRKSVVDNSSIFSRAACLPSLAQLERISGIRLTSLTGALWLTFRSI